MYISVLIQGSYLRYLNRKKPKVVTLKFSFINKAKDEFLKKKFISFGDLRRDKK